MTRWKEERGVAMITVVLVSLIILTISIAAFQLSLGSLNHSALDRKRDEAIQAAQAAVGSYIAALPSTTMICNGVGTSYTLPSTQKITYQITSIHWSADGSTWSSSNTSNTGTAGYCTTSSTAKYGSAIKSSGAKLIVTGSGTAGAGVQTVTRKWQSLVDLSAILGGSTNAFYGNTGLCINNNPMMIHQSTGNDAQLYSGGDIDTTSLCGNVNGNGSMVVEGNVYAQGSISLNGCVEGNIWAGGSVTLSGAYVGACSGATYASGYSITNNQPPNPVCNGQMNNFCYFQDSSGAALGSVTAAGGSITLTTTNAFGKCTSSGGQTWNNSSACSPNRDSTGFNPAPCTQTVGNGSANCGTANAAGLTAPPSSDMPQFLYSSSDWTGPYTVVNESSGNCTTIESDMASKISSGVSGNYNLVFYINPSCALTIPNNTTFTLKGNAIIITTGSFSSTGFTVATSSGSCNTSATDNAGNAMYPNSICQFDVLVPYDTVATPTSSCPLPNLSPPNPLGAHDISFGSTTDLSGVDFFAYTPCSLDLSQKTRINGQGVAGVVNEANNFQLNFHKIVVPGFLPTGYNVAPEFFRECSTADTTGYC